MCSRPTILGPSFAPKPQLGLRRVERSGGPVARYLLRICRWFSGSRRSKVGGKAARPRALGFPSVAPLVRLLQTSKAGFTRRHRAFGDCGKSCGRRRQRCRSLQRQDKELETEGVFMNTRIKLAIAVSAAMWMVPIPRAVAGIDVSAGDWKLDFSGNVNAFYVGSSCDHDANTTV